MKAKKIAGFFSIFIFSVPLVLGQFEVPERKPMYINKVTDIPGMNLQLRLDPGMPASGINTDRAGSNIAVLGDINGDGYDDWAVGRYSASDYESGEPYTGAVFFYLGGPDRRTVEGPADLILRGEEPGKSVGHYLRRGGDFNNDGYDDFLLSDYYGWHMYYGGNPLDLEPDLTFRKLDQHGGFLSFAANAGDVNKDGYDDILLSVPTQIAGRDTAHAYLLYGGENMDDIPDKIFAGEFWAPTSNSAGGAANFSGAQTAGDMNNDGFGDIMITGNSGVRLYFGEVDMDTDHDLLFDNLLGGGTGTGPGLLSVGDLNNDGYDDIVLTANVANTKAVVFYGGEVVDNIPDVEIPSFADVNYYGISTAALGDQNKDGFDDIMLGISTNWKVDTGEVRIFYGGDPMDSIADEIFIEQVPYQSFGNRVDGGGDFDGDGFNDFIVGSNGFTASLIKSDDAGGISLFYGSETFGQEPDVFFSGSANNESFGFSASIIGDVNNDGYFDILVGSRNYWDKNTYRTPGKAYLYLGSESFNDQPDLLFKSPNFSKDVYFGTNVMGVGDLNGDNYDDFSIEEQGNIFIYLGGESMDTINDYFLKFPDADQRFTPVGDVNKDGFDDILYGDVLQGIGGIIGLYLGEEPFSLVNDALFEGKQGALLGKVIEAAGDLNGDGYADFAISAPGISTNGMNEGAVYIYFGSDTPGNTPDLILPGHFQNQQFGRGYMSGGRDFNGDNFDDLLISDYLFSETASSQEGKVYVYFGGEDMDSIADFTITGDSAGYRLGNGVLMIPDINGDGFDEIMCNEGSWMNNIPERTPIFFGGDHPDTIADISLGYSFGYFDFDGFMNDKGISFLLVGDPTNPAAGPQAGRVFLYSTQTALVLEVNPGTLSLGHASGSSESFNITSNTTWSLATTSDWISLTPSSGSDIASVTVTASTANPSTSDPRTASITVSGTGVSDKLLTVSQAPSPVGINDKVSGSLHKCYPNPFSLHTTIEYQLERNGYVELSIYNNLGQEVGKAISGYQLQGTYNVPINAENMETGIYTYRIKTGDVLMIGKMILQK